MASVCFAEKYWVLIDKKSVLKLGQEAGHNEKGDIIAFMPYTAFKPREKGKSYIVKEVEMSFEETQELTAPEIKIKYVDFDEIVDKKDYQEVVDMMPAHYVIKKVKDYSDTQYAVTFTETVEVVKRERKRNIDIDNLPLKDKLTKQELYEKVIVKPDIFAVTP